MSRGLYDSCGRRIHYLRVSVTDRCNLRCTYCMPAEGIVPLPHARILRLEEIRDVVAVAASLGIDKVRLTGGEPLVRSGIIDLVAMLAAVPGIRDLAMSSNGILLERHAAALRAAGLQRINLSLDTLDPARFRAITRGGEVSQVLAGLAAARAAGFPIKLNCVVEDGPDEPDARLVAAFAAWHDLPVRFIPRMDQQAGRFSRVIGGDGGDCSRCNRLRLSSDGLLYPCLFSDLAFPVREYGARRAFELAVAGKPATGRHSRNRIYALGG